MLRRRLVEHSTVDDVMLERESIEASEEEC